MIKRIFILFLISYAVLNGSYLRENNSDKGVVLDTSSNLIWQDYTLESKSWKDAIKYCEDLEIGIYKSWKLPNYTELYSIVELSNKEPSLPSKFQQRVSSVFWTSTMKSIDNIWVIDFNTGSNGYNYPKESKLKVRCVHRR
jgi:hypothetical protein